MFFLKDLLTLISSQVVQVSMSENCKYYLNILKVRHNGVMWRLVGLWWMDWCGDQSGGVVINQVKWWSMEWSGDVWSEVGRMDAVKSDQWSDVAGWSEGVNLLKPISQWIWHLWPSGGCLYLCQHKTFWLRTSFVLFCHLGHLQQAKCYWMASVTKSVRFVFEVFFCVSPWPLRNSFWCTADFQVHM